MKETGACKRHKYSPDEIRYLSDNVAGRSYAEITSLFNKRFGYSFSVGRISSTLGNHKLTNGLNHTGQVPHNKGKKGIVYPGCEKGWFKPGLRPPKYRPIGSERVNKSGCLEIKITDGRKGWKPKHVVIWEDENGNVPKGHVVIFADRNRLNFAIDNLLLVSRGELVRMNQLGLVKSNKGLTKTGQLIVKIKMLINERRRNP